MKRLILAAALLILLVIPCAAYGEPVDDAGIKDAMSAYDFSSWQSYMDALPDEVRSIWDNAGIEEILSGLSNGTADYTIDLNDISRVFTAALRSEAQQYRLVVAIMILSGVAIALLGEEQKNPAAIAKFLCSGVCALVIASSMVAQVRSTSQAIEALGSWIELVMPVTVVVMSALGAAASSGALQTVMVFLTGTVFKIFTGILLPWILCGGVIAIAGGISGRSETDQILKLVKSSVKWTIGIIFTVFLSTLSVKGLSAAGVDSVSIKTLKYALDKSVPVVGSMLSGTYDTVRAYTLLIKNAAGITASMVVVGSLLAPACDIIITAIALRILSAVGALVSNPEISRMFSSLADIYTYIFGALVTVAVMSIILLGAMMAMGGGI